MKPTEVTNLNLSPHKRDERAIEAAKCETPEDREAFDMLHRSLEYVAYKMRGPGAARQKEESDNMFIIHAKTTEAAQSPRYVIPAENGDYIALGRKSDAKTFNTRDAAACYLKRHGVLVKDYDIEQTEPGR